MGIDTHCKYYKEMEKDISLCHIDRISPPDILFENRQNGYNVIEDESWLLINKKTVFRYEILVPGIQFSHFVYQDVFHETIESESSQPYFSMIYNLGPNLRLKNKNNHAIISDLQTCEYGMFYIGTDSLVAQIEANNGDEVLVINFSLQHFEQLIPNTHLFFSDYENAKVIGVNKCLNNNNLQISHAMKKLLDSILATEHSANYKFLHLKSKVIELLLLQLLSIEKVPKIESDNVLSSSNMDKMYEARDIIMSNLSRPCSLMDLAKQIGTNECYLKRHFKQAFGNTVYGFLHEKRMEKSKELLQDEQAKVAEVAKSIGYKHGSHFAAAFKKYFGFLPNELRLFFPTMLSLLIDFQELFFVESLEILV